MVIYFVFVNEVLGSLVIFGLVYIVMGIICKEMESNIYCMILEFFFFDLYYYNLLSLFKVYVFSFYKSVV